MVPVNEYKISLKFLKLKSEIVRRQETEEGDSSDDEDVTRV